MEHYINKLTKESSVTDEMTYDVAIVGYGPVGVTAANLLGQMGLNVVVVERDPNIYARARAISTDEEVVRIWQQIGLADRLNADMQPGCGANFVDANGVPFVKLLPVSRGNGHPPQQFIYQPALEKVLRAGVDRFPNVSVLLEHECLRVAQRGDHVELMLADLTVDEFRRIRASYVIAADGGSSAIRGQLGIGFGGRTFAERWIVIDTKVLNEWPGHDRLRFHCNPDRPTVDCPTPLGHHRWEFPVRDEEDERDLLTEDAIWTVLRGQGITEDNVKILGFACYSHHVRFADRWRVGRVFLAGDAAHAMPPWIGQGMCAGVRDVANLCWKLGAVLSGIAARIGARHLPGRAATARQRGDQPRRQDRQADHSAQPLARGGAQPHLPHRQQGALLHRLAARPPLDPRCPLPRRSRRQKRQPAPSAG